ncbi:DNA-binding protein [Sulfuritalea hydrogenivorans]|uniref:Cointegrate resolution protein T n=1 Tax=Sulfuritalea hydrogenivorans sk43H TaxID=1223802 RepID=W0SI96_9PROT|nr:DNA-binding protein [Sulfuritalea hydrogenivorans]BAO29638.1 cointegrate resolution protein T [Sulfuritalea hydrogenivorans sk43H]
MARGGIYKAEVIRARDKLLAVGRYPSIDAVRQELGNTGSKATIHRYLKEIEEEEGGKSGTKVAISEALQDLVARLAERLQIEADARIAEVKAKYVAELTEQRQMQEAVEAEAAGLRKALEKVQADLTEEQTRHQRTAERLQHEITAHAIATQQVTDFEDRLRTEERHRRSLEEKHTHAREALEHFRTATKEQREQDQRQHEQQVQYLQSEVKTIGNSLIQAQQVAATSNQENARLTSELSQSGRSLHDARAEVRALKDVKAELVAAQQQMDRLGRRVAELETQIGAANATNEQLAAGRAQDRAEIHQLQISLTAARSAAETQEQLAEKIQAWMNQKPGPAGGAPAAGTR